MKNQEQGKINLDDIIQAYMVSTLDNGEDTLSAWIERYPQYEQELREFAAHWKLFERVPERNYTEEEESTLISRAVSVVQNILYNQREEASTSASEKLSGLIEAAEKQSLSLDQFAETTGMSAAILTMLDDRRVRYTSIPRKAIENIAGAIQKLVKTVDAYLSQGMQLAPAHYRSDSPPKASGSYDFAYLVSIDLDLSDQQREQWLALIPTISDSESGTGE